MTIDTATMEDHQARTEHLRRRLSSLHLNPPHHHPTPPQQLHYDVNNLRDGPDGQQVFYDDDGLIFDMGLGNVIVVDSLPVVEAERVENFQTEIRQAFSEFGVIKPDGISMPINPSTRKTMGRCFIEFNSHQEAELARVKRDGYILYMQVLSVNLYDDFGSFTKVPDVETTPESNPFTSSSVVYPGPSSLQRPQKYEDEPQEAEIIIS